MPDYSVLGGQSEATIDQANIAMRASPWYQSQLRAWGQDPGHPTLQAWQRDQLTRTAQANGYIVDQGNIEMDDHGNWNPKGHKLRNTIIVIGLAAATIATMGAAGAFAGAAGAGGAGAAAGTGATVAGVEGGAAGLSSAALAGLGTGAMGAVPIAAGVGGAAAAGAPVLEGLAAGGGGASTAIPAGAGALEATTTVPLATDTIAGGTGLAGGAGASTAAIPVGTTLKSASAIAAAKEAGYTINDAGVVTDAANVPSTAFDYYDPSGSASTRSYADILKYGLPTAGQVVGSLIAANASGKASDAQQKYLEDALAYEKENDLYNRGVAADKVKLEASRYADYTGRIGGFVANGQSSNDRMASLLGLPARSGATSGGAASSSSYGTPGPQGVTVSPELTQRVLDNYKALGLTPTGPGTGPTDSAYFADKYAATGGSSADNDAYWFGPQGRIAKEASQAGLKFTPGAPAPSPPPADAPKAPAPSAPLGVQGAPAAKLVTLRWPDGSTLNVNPDQVDQYRRGGASVVGA